MNPAEVFTYAWLFFGGAAWCYAEGLLIRRTGFDPLDLLILPIFLILGPFSFWIVWRLS